MTLAIGAAGGVVFWLLGMPLAFLSGSAAAVAAAALAGVRSGVHASCAKSPSFCSA